MMTRDRTNDPSSTAKKLKRTVRLARGAQDFTWRVFDEHAAMADRIRNATVIASFQGFGPRLLTSIEDAVGKELEKLAYPSRLGHFSVEMRVHADLDGNFLFIEPGAWSPLSRSAELPRGRQVRRHPALGVAGIADDLAKILVLVEEVRAAVDCGDAGPAAKATWDLCTNLQSLGAHAKRLDSMRGHARRLGGKQGRTGRKPDPDQEVRWQRWRELSAELEREDPRRKPTHIARLIEKATGDKWEAIRKHLRKHKMSSE